MADEDRSSYLEPIEPVSRDLNSQGRKTDVPAQVPNPTTSQWSGIYNTVDSGNYQQDYTDLSGKHQYDDLHGREKQDSIRYERLKDQVHMHNMPNKQVNSPENPKQSPVVHTVIFCCSVASLILNCPVGIFSVCYAYMAKTERFYPMKRYYLCMTFAVAFLSIIGFLITIILIAVILSNTRRS